jgi:hypothetical protein
MSSKNRNGNAMMRGCGKLIHEKSLKIKKSRRPVPLSRYLLRHSPFQDIIGSIHSAAQAIQPTEKTALRSVKLLPFFAV